jgi:hypothetical protein
MKANAILGSHSGNIYLLQEEHNAMRQKHVPPFFPCEEPEDSILFTLMPLNFFRKAEILQHLKITYPQRRELKRMRVESNAG